MRDAWKFQNLVKNFVFFFLILRQCLTSHKATATRMQKWHRKGFAIDIYWPLAIHLATYLQNGSRIMVMGPIETINYNLFIFFVLLTLPIVMHLIS